MSVSTSTTVFRVQELCDHILEFDTKTGRDDDLKACALSVSESSPPWHVAVYFCADPDILALLSTISFSNLNEIKLIMNVDNCDTAKGVSPLVRDLIGLPSLRRVEVSNLLAQCEDLEAMFSSPTLAVTELSFNFVRIVVPSSKPTRPGGQIQRPAVKYLKLMHSARLTECVKRLKMQAADAPEISLDSIPALTCLHLTTEKKSLENIAAILSQITAATLINTAIVEMVVIEDEVVQILQNLDAVVASLSSLHRFEVRLDCYEYELSARGMEGVARRVKDCFPQVFSKGILCATHYRRGGAISVLIYF
ncbi:hypothetical protein C8J57DRAFT_1724554 [Mycena rebaudengoi]|nr:hypothetical protein C8J57DRAFT_1728597 [Mycena rebaudengoi]KAJ7247315.1 hypothetical protein C8J57DRAFT_1724554 [Mycena rebaudengoi]